MAEHSRSSGVFSRRLAVVNGGCCRPPARPRRYPVQSSLRRDPHTGVCVCKSGALPKKLAPTAPRHPPAAYAAETTTSLSPCSLSARQKSLSVQVWSRDRGCISRIFFLHNHLHCLSQHLLLLLLLLLLPDHYLPLFCNRQKWPFG